MNAPPRLVIFGAGALGRFLHSHVRAGANVTLLDRSAPTSASAAPEECDEVWICTKAYDAADALAAARGRFPGCRAASVFSNGLGLAEPCARAWGEPVGRVLCNFGVAPQPDGTVRLHGAPEFYLGLPEWPRERAARLRRALEGPGSRLTVCASPEAAEWKKALINIVVNPLCALARAKNGAVIEDAGLHDVARALLREARAVAAARGVPLSHASDTEVFAAIAPHAENRNSMLLDLEARRRTENEFLLGTMLRWGAEHGVPTPVTATIHALVEAAERRAGGG